MQEKTFVFKKRDQSQLNTDSHTTFVEGEQLYCNRTGFGFVTEDNKAVDKSLQIPEINAGFTRNRTDISSDTTVFTGQQGCYVKEGSFVPMHFKIDVIRKGNYDINVKFIGKGAVYIFAGARRLVYRNTFAKEQELSYSFTINVCDMIPNETAYLYEHRSIDICFVGEKIIVEALAYKCVNCPTIYIAGDSTVMDKTAYYPYKPLKSYAGWGQMLSAFLKKGISVSNHAKEGLNMESFRMDGYYAMIKAHLRIGDYVLIHFSRVEDAGEYEIDQDRYRSGFIEYIEETRAMGAYPIIVTPYCRNIWNAGKSKLTDIQQEYAQICREIGKTYSVPVIDLHMASKNFISNLGEKKSAYYFMKDGINLNDLGAYKMAECVYGCYIELMRRVKADAYARLANYLVEKVIPWESE